MTIRRNRMSKKGPDPFKASLLSIMPALIIAVAIMAGGVYILSSSGGDEPAVYPAPSQDAAYDDAALPQFVAAAPGYVQSAYLFALERPDVMRWMPCYCGCGDHDDHKSAHDCFIRKRTPDGVEFDEHGANCDVCVGIVLDSKKLWEQGDSLPAIRAFIDDKYGSIGPGTDTPLPPE
jgi:hypothetical protein